MPVKTITPCLWFDGQAEAAAAFYVGVFPQSRIVSVMRYPDAGQDVHGQTAGSVLTVDFELDGRPFVALNGGPEFKFNEAVSLQVYCDTQAEIDRYWAALGDGGDPAARQCGWLKDRFGLAWQVVPNRLIELMKDPDAGRAARAMTAMMGMKKIDIAAIEKAVAG